MKTYTIENHIFLNMEVSISADPESEAFRKDELGEYVEERIISSELEAFPTITKIEK